MTTLPHNLELEAAVLAVFLDGRDASEAAAAADSIPHFLVFCGRNHRFVWQAISDLLGEGLAVDGMAVAERMRCVTLRSALDRVRQQERLAGAGILDQMHKDQLRAFHSDRPEYSAEDWDDSVLAAIGGYEELARLAGAYTTSSTLGRNVRMLLDLYHKRRLILACQGIERRTHEATAPFVDVVGMADDAIRELAQSADDGDLSLMDAGTMVEDVLDREESIGKPVVFGLRSLDAILDLTTEDFCVLAGFPGGGKTSLALHALDATAALVGQPGACMMVSLEMTRERIAAVLAGRHAGVTPKAILRHELSDSEADRVRACARDMAKSNATLLRGTEGGYHISHIVRDIKRAQRKYPALRLVVIDNLSILDRGGKEEYHAMSEASRALRLLTNETGICVLGLCQLRKPPAGKKDESDSLRKARISDLKGSSTIEQDCTKAVLLSRVREDYQGDRVVQADVEAHVAKSTFGSTGSCELSFEMARGQVFRDLNSAPRQPAPERPERYESVPEDDEDLFS